MSAENRKKQLVHRDIQLTLVRRILMQWVLFVLATGIVTVTLQYLVDPLQTSEVIGQRIKLTVGSMLLVSACLAPMFIRDSIKLSHRVVGPIVRLRTLLQQVDPTIENERMQLRSSDFFKEVAKDYNEMLIRVESKAVQESDA